MGVMPRDPQSSYLMLLAARAAEQRHPAGRKPKLKIRLRYKIRHIMWLSVWVALVLSLRPVFVESLPTVAMALFVMSEVVAAVSFIVLVAIAVFVEGGKRQDRLIVLVSYFMTVAVAPHLIFLLYGIGWAILRP